MCLWAAEADCKNIICKGYVSKSGGDGDYLTAVMNMVSGKNSLLEKMFESQSVSKEGIYRVKIHQTQTNIWKYVVVDDFVPVIVNKRLPVTERYRPGNVRPAFLDVDAVCQEKGGIEGEGVV